MVSVTSISGGSAYNVIPEAVTIKGTFRALTTEKHLQLRQRLEEVSACRGFTTVVNLGLLGGTTTRLCVRDLAKCC